MDLIQYLIMGDQIFLINNYQKYFYRWFILKISFPFALWDAAYPICCHLETKDIWIWLGENSKRKIKGSPYFLVYSEEQFALTFNVLLYWTMHVKLVYFILNLWKAFDVWGKYLEPGIPSEEHNFHEFENVQW